MHIKILKYKNKKGKIIYKADCIDLPGSPPAPESTNEGEAIARLFFLLMKETYINSTPDNWLRMINLEEFRCEHEML